MKSWGSVLATCVLFVTANSGAYATCLLSDLNGAWRIYMWAGPGAPATWTKCTVEVIEGSGKVAANRVCEDEGGASYLTTGGLLSVSNVCRVSGFVDTQAGRINLLHSFLETDHNQVWTGIAVNVDGVNATFTGVKGLSTGGIDDSGGTISSTDDTGFDDRGGLR